MFLVYKETKWKPERTIRVDTLTQAREIVAKGSKKGIGFLYQDHPCDFDGDPFAILRPTRETTPLVDKLIPRLLWW